MSYFLQVGVCMAYGIKFELIYCSELVSPDSLAGFKREGERQERTGEGGAGKEGRDGSGKRRKGRGRREGGGEGEAGEISPPMSFLKVGAYGDHFRCCRAPQNWGIPCKCTTCITGNPSLPVCFQAGCNLSLLLRQWLRPA